MDVAGKMCAFRVRWLLPTAFCCVAMAVTMAACGSPGKKSLPSSTVPTAACPTPGAAALATPSARAAAASPAQPSWPVFQHDARHSSTSTVDGPAGGAVRWTRQLEGGIEQAPITASDGTIYIASNGGVLHALDPQSGADRWTFDGGARYGSDLSTAPAILADGTILWPGPRSTLYALTPAGQQLWTRQFDSPLLSPALAPDGTVYLAEMNGHLHALQLTGDGASERWVSDLGTHDSLYGSTALGLDGTIYQTVGNRVVALKDSRSRAEILWHFDIASGSEVSAAVGRNDVVVFGTNDNFEYGIDSSGSLLWRYPRNSLSYSSPAVTDDGLAYFGDHNGFMNVVNSESGCLLIRYQGGDEVWTAPAIDRTGRVYFGTRAGHVLGYERDGRRLFDFDTGAIVGSYPSLTADGTLLIGSANGKLYAFHD